MQIVQIVSKELQKATIRSKLNSKFLKDRTEGNTKAYCKHRNICVNILHKTKQQYHSNLKVSKVADKIFFWKIMKNFLSNKSNNFETITLVGNNMLTSDN